MRMFAALCAAFILCLTASNQVIAQESLPELADHEQELRARDIGRALRCVVCQNQSIEESDASLAVDMRRLVRARVKEGDSNAEVISYMQGRYGDFVLLKPPVQSNTYILWFAPFILALLGLLWFLRQSRRRPETVPAAPLSQEELARLEKLDHSKGEP